MNYLWCMEQATHTGFTDSFLKALGLDPTDDQLRAIQFLASYLSPGNRDGIFILKGFAGTGKTTLLAALTKIVSRFVLLAPTGRAAKVLSGYSGFSASTIHRHIYKLAASADGNFKLIKNENKFVATTFIVDESSMIGDGNADDSFSGAGNLLEDLMDYVSSGKNCKLILVGDTAQLPPVKSDDSPALDVNHVRTLSGLGVVETELKQVVRQQEAGGILLNATALRILINRNADTPVLKTAGFNDISQVSSYELKDLLEDCFNKFGWDEVLIITKSNKSANQYNQLIRRQILWYEDELCGGDRLMIVRNNYFWLDKDSKAGFIANGDTAEVQRVKEAEEKYGLRFATVQLRLIDYPDEPSFEATVLLDTLYSEAPSITWSESKKLYDALQLEYADYKPVERRKLIKENVYYNALQVKFAYSVTCHKAQGGQWKTVFVDQGYMTEEMKGVSHLRWLYTAFTRATEKLYLINFDPANFKI